MIPWIPPSSAGDAKKLKLFVRMFFSSPSVFFFLVEGRSGTGSRASTVPQAPHVQCVSSFGSKYKLLAAGGN